MRSMDRIIHWPRGHLVVSGDFILITKILIPKIVPYQAHILDAAEIIQYFFFPETHKST